MTSYWFAQAVGAIAFLVGITVFFHRDDRKFKLQLSLYSAIIGIHFFLMGANAAGASALLNAGRTVIATRTHNLVVMFAFIILTLVFGLSGLKHAVELLPILGTLISTWALFRTSGLTTRCIIWCATLCWVIHNVWLGSIGGSLIEGTFLILNGYNIIRFWRMQKRGLDPFRAETQSH
ncbi:YgjV family protein [Symbiopectobacterium purcellii]|uniref:YgjV family protein n=1 Tax=Symbiopectobacterium purcellii TaxID=2871826 RepID=A0ABX9AQL6_9ENTR|nr:YgjV family protein [Symbiopectobacterium purcellii]QZN96321.1 YgjV family protein [Symbiopectobacterium purcellii]